MSETKQFPEGMTPLAGAPFTFRCHPGVSCFTVCCKKVDLDLYPYDIIRLKNNLSIDSEQFLRSHTELAKGANPYFPALKLKLKHKAGVACCPFLDETGCLVYRDRPTACRTYPLERAVDRSAARGRGDDYYFLVKHDYCKGHYEDQEMNAKRWIRNQQLDTFNLMNERWTEIDTLFATNPWKGEGSGGPKQQLAFMVCYDIDGFRRFAAGQRLVEQYQLKRELRKKLERDDEELLKFGFEWLKDIFGGRSVLLRR